VRGTYKGTTLGGKGHGVKASAEGEGVEGEVKSGRERDGLGVVGKGLG
jgi:hypothetical protein